jgi:DNA-binding transcriptional LysR family regulator
VLGFETSLARVPGARWLEQHGQGCNVVMRCRELMDMVAACTAGIGLAVLPLSAAVLEPTLLRLTDEVLGSSKLSVVFRKEVLIAEPIRAVIEFVTEVLRRDLGRR